MIETLKNRFYENMERHPDLNWEYVESRLRENVKAIETLAKMEESGGEPDTIGIDPESGKLIFCDCSAETPAGRRSLCYDDEALRKRTKNPPVGSAVTQAQEMGVSLLTEELYYRLQEHGLFDRKTSSWISTPDDIRNQGGALFCECRYGRVFTFHNGADSYYSVRGWRGFILV
ncbi:MAG: DUF4256 domain-containing protein [Erysipelotrichaceae bacterium]|nr:DUF4256 domain-containing protein [Erysipelotrichaceae bacterium]